MYLRYDIGKIMSTCQDITDEFIFDDTFTNLRENCFGQKLYSKFGNKNHSRFEYLCIYLHTRILKVKKTYSNMISIKVIIILDLSFY